MALLYVALTVNALTCVLHTGFEANTCTDNGTVQTATALEHGGHHGASHHHASASAGGSGPLSDTDHLSLCACLDKLASTTVAASVGTPTFTPRLLAHVVYPDNPIHSPHPTGNASPRGPPAHHFA